MMKKLLVILAVCTMAVATVDAAGRVPTHHTPAGLGVYTNTIGQLRYVVGGRLVSHADQATLVPVVAPALIINPAPAPAIVPVVVATTGSAVPQPRPRGMLGAFFHSVGNLFGANPAPAPAIGPVVPPAPVPVLPVAPVAPGGPAAVGPQPPRPSFIDVVTSTTLGKAVAVASVAHAVVMGSSAMQGTVGASDYLWMQAAATLGAYFMYRQQ